MVKRFQGKKILLMGLGLHGGGLSVVTWLLKNKANITITDLKSRQQLKTAISKINHLAGAKNINYVLGRHNTADFLGADLIIQNPAVPSNSPFLESARQAGVPIINEAVMFFGLYPGRSIGVTGTRGKSTTATLLHKILKTEIPTNVVAGNIATNPMLQVLGQLKVKSLPVLELSSWHLEGMGDYGVSPYMAIVTNVLNDHLNRYNSFADYKKAKQLIVKYQLVNDIAILNADNTHSYSFRKNTKAKTYFFSLYKKVKGCYLKTDNIYFYDGHKNDLVMSLDKIKLLGKHNLSNILAAVTAAKILGIKNKNITKAVNNFKGVDCRLEFKGKVEGIEVYNDSTSTTPDATLAAIDALAKKRLVLIVGGEDKQLSYTELAHQIRTKVAKTILLTGSGSEKLIKELNKTKYSSHKLIKDIKSLKQAWELAKESAEEGSVILFSPAAASFNMFNNEFDRARQFDKLFYGWQKKKTK